MDPETNYEQDERDEAKRAELSEMVAAAEKILFSSPIGAALTFLNSLAASVYPANLIPEEFSSILFRHGTGDQSKPITLSDAAQWNPYPALESFTKIPDLNKDFAVSDLSGSWMYANLPTGQIEKVLALATVIFEDAAFAKDWLNRPNLATDEKPPVALLGTEEGLARVETLLHRIEYGVLA